LPDCCCAPIELIARIRDVYDQTTADRV